MVYDNDRYLAKSLIELGEFAEAQVSLFEQLVKPGMIVVDAGANLGAHTVAFAKMGAFVHAYEPQRAMFHLLCGNVALNGLQSVHCHRQALGKATGHIPISVLDLNAQENNFGSFRIDMGGQPLDTVEMVRLEQPCHFLKVDVEGHEVEVLEGARDMIRACQPWLYVENDRAEKSAELIDLVRSLGYTPYWHITDLDNPENFNGRREPLLGCQSIDMVCAPAGVEIDGFRVATQESRKQIIFDKEAA